MAELELKPAVILDDRIQVPDRNVSGASDSNVKDIQDLLIENDYLEEGQSDGYFGDISAAALAAYNEDEKIKFEARMNPAGTGGADGPGGDSVPNAEMLELQEQLKTALADVDTNKTLFETTQATLGKVNSELAKSKGIQETSVKNSQDIIKDTLAFYGLPASLAAKLNAKLIGGESATGIAMSIRETDEYAARFPAMAQRRKLNLPAISEADYLDLERSYRQIGQAAKLPADFYDKPDDFDQLIAGDVSPQEYNERVQLGMEASLGANQDTVRLLRDFYDITDSDLTAYYLDPERATSIFEDRRRMESAGLAAASRQTIGEALNMETAEALQAENVQAREIQQRLGQRVGLTDQLLGEEEALSASTIAEAEFGLDVDAATRMRRRREERTTGFRGRSGALTTAAGVSTLGEAT